MPTIDIGLPHSPWWRHQMETFSVLLAICAGNSPVPVNSPHKGQWRGALMFTLICARINDWVNNREAGDLRRHLDHYDVSVMPLPRWEDVLAPWLNRLINQLLHCGCWDVANLTHQQDCFGWQYEYLIFNFKSLELITCIIKNINLWSYAFLTKIPIVAAWFSPWDVIAALKWYQNELFSTCILSGLYFTFEIPGIYQMQYFLFTEMMMTYKTYRTNDDDLIKLLLKDGKIM